MKNLTVLAAALLLFVSSSFSQSTPKKHYLMISIIESGGPAIMVVTKDDGTQEKRNVRLPNISLFHMEKSFMEHEDSVFLALKPFFDDGWKLVTNTSIVTNSSSIVDRYYFTKQDD